MPGRESCRPGDGSRPCDHGRVGDDAIVADAREGRFLPDAIGTKSAARAVTCGASGYENVLSAAQSLLCRLISRTATGAVDAERGVVVGQGPDLDLGLGRRPQHPDPLPAQQPGGRGVQPECEQSGHAKVAFRYATFRIAGAHLGGLHVTCPIRCGPRKGDKRGQASGIGSLASLLPKGPGRPAQPWP